jgi:hypothetical protein
MTATMFLDKVLHQSGFSDSGFTAYQRNVSLPAACLEESIVKQPLLGFTLEQLRQSISPWRLTIVRLFPAR